MSNLQLRVISAVILAIVVLGITWLGGTPFRLLACVIGAAILYEACAMSRSISGPANQWIAAAGLALALIPMAVGATAVATQAILVLAIIATGLHGFCDWRYLLGDGRIGLCRPVGVCRWPICAIRTHPA